MAASSEGEGSVRQGRPIVPPFSGPGTASLRPLFRASAHMTGRMTLPPFAAHCVVSAAPEARETLARAVTQPMLAAIERACGSNRRARERLVRRARLGHFRARRSSWRHYRTTRHRISRSAGAGAEPRGTRRGVGSRSRESRPLVRSEVQQANSNQCYS